MPIWELPLARMEQSSGQQMEEIPGLARRAEPRVFSMASRSQTQIMGRPLARVALSSGQQIADRTGLVRPVGPRAFCGASPLRTQIMEPPSVAMERSSEQQMEETRGLPRQAERLTRLSVFSLPMRITGRLW